MIDEARALDLEHTIVEAVEPANVDTVVVDGRILKRHGKLTVIDAAKVADEATATALAIRKRV